MDARAPGLRHKDVTRSPRPHERVGGTLPAPARTATEAFVGAPGALVVTPSEDTLGPGGAGPEPGARHARGAPSATEAGSSAGHAFADAAAAVPRGPVVIVVALPAAEASLASRAHGHDLVAGGPEPSRARAPEATFLHRAATPT